MNKGPVLHITLHPINQNCMQAADLGDMFHMLLRCTSAMQGAFTYTQFPTSYITFIF